jgi:hypothetical protein
MVTKNNGYANLNFDTPNLSIIANKRHANDVQSLNEVIGKEKTSHDLHVKVVEGPNSLRPCTGPKFSEWPHSKSSHNRKNLAELKSCDPFEKERRHLMHKIPSSV